MNAASIGLEHFLVVSAILFSLGAALIITRRNAVLVLMGLELVLNAAALNFVAFSRFIPSTERASRLTGDAVTAFVIVLAAAEAAVALAIVLNMFNNFSTIDVEEIDQLRE